MALRSRAPLPIPKAASGFTDPNKDREMIPVYARIERLPPGPSIPVPVSTPEAKPTRRGRASTREGKRAMQVWLAPEAVLQMNYLALDEDTTVQALMEEAVEALFRAKGKARLRG